METSDHPRIQRPPGIRVFRPGGRRAALSVVELLVVIGCLALLVVLLVPVVNRAVVASHTPKCASNLKQLWMGIALYAQDHNGNLPPSKEYVLDENGTPTSPKPFYKSASGWPYRYIDDSWPEPLKIFRCPADKSPNKKQYYWIYATNYCYFVSYADGKPVASGKSGSKTDNSLGRPMRLKETMTKILMVDGMDSEEAKSWKDGPPLPAANDSGVNAVLTWGNTRRILSRRHQGSGNVLFGDGSVRLLTYAQIRQSDIERDDP